MGTQDVADAMTQMQNQDHLDALAETDLLLFADAMGEERHRKPDNDGDRSLEEISGWDGAPLPIEEIAHTNLSGFDPNGFDRPLETERDNEITARDNEIAQLRSHVQILQELSDPAYQARVAQERERQVASIYADPYAAIDEMARLRQAANGGTMEALNVNLAASHRAHGRAFEAAYGALTALDARNPVDRATVATIMSQDDPGRALMEWHSRTWRGMGSGSGGPPFARGLGRAAPADNSNSRGPEDQNDWGSTGIFGDSEEVEKQLMNDAWR